MTRLCATAPSVGAGVRTAEGRTARAFGAACHLPAERPAGKLDRMTAALHGTVVAGTTAVHIDQLCDSRAVPLFTYDPRRGETVAERPSLQGRPAQPNGRSAGPDFAADGTPTAEMERTAGERLADWCRELAGI